MEKHASSLLRRLLPAAVLAAAAVAGFFFFTGFIGARADAETLSMAERSVRTAAVECYAIEGFYPESLSYLTERYGVTAQGRGYKIEYQFVASNLMPDITVLAAKD